MILPPPNFTAQFQQWRIRPWQEADRMVVANLIQSVLTEYGLPWQPETADRDVIEIEDYYQQTGGEFWVIEEMASLDLVGTGGYYPITRGEKAVEIRKMYFLPQIRGKGLGSYLLSQLETRIHTRGFSEIWIETSSLLPQAVILYEKAGYSPATGIETPRCDRVYSKRFNGHLPR